VKRRGRDVEIPTLLNTLHYDNSMAHLSSLHNVEVESVSINEKQEKTALCVYFEKLLVLF
jgi:hypothetical protein